MNRTTRRRNSCGKVRFRDELDGKIALMKAQRARDRRGDPVVEKRVYPCRRCHGYHLTSQPLNGAS